ncbi:MAG TPA: restriction endonuclease subunit S [Devosia sp.]|uniref:restriction endonuclease subunit S n=1 Tax=Devosia sp. TaxID=1871048 RepID=UPI002DDD276F|nr:restriction endonuclease subunit S [Devosia sp.]HEV2517047.1 restriction endonuclease subunit S [Devosia sp.]
MTQEARLVDLLTFTRDGEWGNGEPSHGYSPALVVRGTDFSEVRAGNISTLPLRYIRSDILARKAIVVGDTLIETAGGTKDQPTGRSVFIQSSILASAKFPMICASFARFLRPNPAQVEPNFLFWKLQDEYESRRMFPYHVQHTGVARFQFTQFAETHPFYLPDLPEQRAIASVLSALDDKIELNRRMNETLETMARAIFKDWFVDFGPTRAKVEGRPPYLAPDIWSLFPDRLDDEGKPKGWITSTIGQEVEVLGGSTPSTKEPTYWGGDISWATPKDLSSLSTPVLLSTERQITQAGLSQIGSGLLPAGTVLLSSRAPIGYMAIAQIPVAVNQGFIAMICKKRLSNVFVWLWTQANIETVHQNANGSTFQEISKTNFRPIEVTVPALELLEAFDQSARPLFDRIVANDKESRTLAATRDFLLPKLMSGEVRVGDATSSV